MTSANPNSNLFSWQSNNAFTIRITPHYSSLFETNISDVYVTYVSQIRIMLFEKFNRVVSYFVIVHFEY